MLACVLIWLVIGRFVYQLYIRVRLGDFTFSLAAMLTKKDNKALAVDFACFLFALLWITRGSLTDTGAGVKDGLYFGSFFAYQGVGYVLITLARLLNDKIILRAVDNDDREIVEKGNVAVACAQGGAVIGSAIILSAAASGSGDGNVGEGARTHLFDARIAPPKPPYPPACKHHIPHLPTPWSLRLCRPRPHGPLLGHRADHPHGVLSHGRLRDLHPVCGGVLEARPRIGREPK